MIDTTNLVSIKDYVAAENQRIKEKIAKSGEHYRLDVFQIGDNDASNRYIKWKMKDCEEVGIEAVLHKYEDDNFNIGILWRGLRNCYKKGTCGVLLQLPSPDKAKKCFCDFIRLKPTLDIDGILADEFNPCTPRGIIDWLEYNKVELDGASVTIIGRSDIVGKPLARMMLERNATVTVCHSHTDVETLHHNCLYADIIVSAVGKPKFLSTSDFVSEDQIIIDVGINKDENGKLCGDIENDYCVNTYVTPVPGGVELLTRLALLKNVIGE